MPLMPTPRIGSGRGRARRLGDPGFDLQRRRPGDGSRLVFATLQDGLRDIVAPLPTALGRVARAHPVAAVIEQLAGEERVRVLPSSRGALRVLGKQQLDAIPCLLINDGIVKTIMDLAFVCEASKVNRVRQDLVEMAPADEPPPMVLPVPSVRNGNRMFSWSRSALSRTTLPISR